MIAVVSYQIATYSGHVEVPCTEDEDSEGIIARAKTALRRKCGGAGIYPGGPCHESWKEVERR